LPAPAPQPAYPPPPQPQQPAYPPASAPDGSSVPTLSAYPAAPRVRPPREPVVDPQGDRVVLLPTATTHAKGTFYFSSYEIAFLQIGYAFTDDTQLSLTALPVPSESVTAIDFTLKSSLHRGGLVRAAALGSASGFVGKDIGVVFIGRAGGVAQVCLVKRCESSLSLSTNFLMIGALLMVNGAGAIVRVSDHVSLLGELATMLPIGTQGGQFSGGMVNGGVRLHYPHWGFDFVLMRVLDRSDEGATLPFFAVTWRS
jgi:hypothetical protein